ncbi:transporter substrate-binding domain-containing protein [Salinicola endophyticus]|uniref:Transporter substrate-binding domain-containing protein n=1 Tax=Salinicola endophyticus TaxID=1949083 RepID=A0ABY8FHP0_9GAMM|nr:MULTISPECIES: transporter substrate-binding domain-containing protein [Salinicola]WFF40061.1 transporter substrate-binding domain-containing protein [Salinicola endophyticus]
MKRLLAGSAFALLTVFTLSATADDDYRVGISAEPYPPFYSPDASGEWSGWEIDFTHALCQRLDATCEIVPLAWGGIIPALKTGKIDMIIGSMGITPERAKQIAFSQKYYDTPTGLLAAKGSDVQPTPEGVKGAYLGVQSGSIQESYAYKYFSHSAADIKVYQTLDEELQDLSAGRIDAVVGDTLAMQPFIDSDLGQACCEFRGNVAADPAVLGRGVGVGLRKEDTELLSRVNAAISDILADGTYQKISKPYFGDLSIYGD